MKKTTNLLLSTVMFLTCYILGLTELSAQNKPKTEPKPAATVNQQSQLPTIIHSGSDIVNYVRNFTFYQPVQTSPTGVNLTNAIDAGNIMQATQYMDGLGRPIQTVARQASGTGKDVVSFIVYDPYGRQVYQPMPYVASTTGGGIQLTPSADQNTFLKNQYPDEDVFYGKTVFDDSPLNRVLKQMAPGNSWVGQGNGVSSEYLTNTAADDIRIWTIGTNPTTSAFYQDRELSVMVTADENGNQVKEYTTKRGLVVLKKVQKNASSGNGHADWLNTYYIYDIYNNLRYVLPPRAVELLAEANWNWTNAQVNDLVFFYTYDGRNRMITKQVPGSGEVNLVYDKADRLVATQDANQHAINQWTFTKYDELNRPVLTGFITKNNTRAQLQVIVDAWPGVLNVTREGLSTANVMEGASITTSVRDTNIDIYRHKDTGFVDFLPGFVSVDNDDFVTDEEPLLSFEYTVYEGYYDGTFPWLSVNPFQVNTVNFYDDYEFTTKEWSTDFKDFYTAGIKNAITPAPHNSLKGAATGSKVRILGTNDFLTTVMFYDDRGRVVQTQGENHLGSTDISTTQYDFVGKVLSTYTIHNNPQAQTNTSTRILKRFIYNKRGGLVKIKEKLNDTGSLQDLVVHSYNDLGELESKVLGDNLETLNYDYNIRGWLKSINGGELDDPAENGSTMTNHYFAMDLSYDHGFEQNQLNGNIAGVKWKSKSSDQIRAYGFDYDKVNRLTKADYNQNDGAANAWSKLNADFSTSYGYDANGNILNLKRETVVAGTITTMDDLTYDYGSTFGLAGNSNQLQSVRDIEGDLGQGDFKDGNTSGPDYSYDLNGNMKDDLNKGITNITYNHLNLPITVSFGSNRSINYAYDAAGIKLSKTVSEQKETGVKVLENTDFSSSLSGWSGYQALAESVLSHSGESHVVKITTNSTNNLHKLQKNITDPGDEKIRVKAKVYLPSANTSANGVQVQVGFSSSDRSQIFTTTDQWIDIEFITAATPNSVFTSFLMTANGSVTFSGSNNDYFFIKDIEIGAVTGTIGTTNSITTTDYAGGFIYENNALQHFGHEEGRVRTNNNGQLVHDYFIKDHLGNTRMTLTEARDSTVYEATMETALATFEEEVFLNVAETRSNEEAFEGTESAKLGPESIGPAKMLVVSPGDTVELFVYAKYANSFIGTNSGNSSGMGMALAALFGTNGGTASVYEQGVYDNLNNNAGTFLASAINTDSSSVPKAYLNYVFFDQDFNLVTGKSGYVQVDAGAKGAFDLISANGLIMEEAGYLYVYLSNEGRTTDGGNVYFDALRVNHKKGTIVQEDHYYPFGLSINALSSSAPLSKPNKFKYNGKEEQTEFDLNWYDYGARMYDPTIGRWNGVDAMAESYLDFSPYVYTANNPIIYIDPDGNKYMIYDENGNPIEYSVGATYDPEKSAYVAQVFNALNYLAKEGGEKGTVATIANDSESLVFVRNIEKNKDESSDPVGATFDPNKLLLGLQSRQGKKKKTGVIGVINWSADVGLETKSGQIQAPVFGLLHESIHAERSIYNYEESEQNKTSDVVMGREGTPVSNKEEEFVTTRVSAFIRSNFQAGAQRNYRDVRQPVRTQGLFSNRKKNP